MPPDATRQHSPAAERNQGPILAVLQRVLPVHGRALEIASGSGQHAQHFAAALPGWTWQPTDPDAAALASIRNRCQEAARPNLLAPLQLDVLWPTWPVAGTFDAVFCANLLHISPWTTCAALMHGAARHLGPGGLLLTYGPYFLTGAVPAPGNLAFDADLRARNAGWGIRWLHDVVAQAQMAGLRLREQVAMPTNNLTLVFERA